MSENIKDALLLLLIVVVSYASIVIAAGFVQPVQR